METWICGSLFVSPVQPYSRANAIVLAQMSICPAIWTERHVHEQSACEAGFGARSAEREIANGAPERHLPPPKVGRTSMASAHRARPLTP